MITTISQGLVGRLRQPGRRLCFRTSLGQGTLKNRQILLYGLRNPAARVASLLHLLGRRLSLVLNFMPVSSLHAVHRIRSCLPRVVDEDRSYRTRYRCRKTLPNRITYCSSIFCCSISFHLVSSHLVRFTGAVFSTSPPKKLVKC